MRDFFEDKNPHWKHVAGGRRRDGDEVDEVPEFHIPNPATDFEKILGNRIDGRKGGKFVDLTFEDTKTGKLIHIQTVDLDKNGKPTQRELDNADTIRKRTGETVILIQKPTKPSKNRK